MNTEVPTVESQAPLRISRLVEHDYMRIESLDISPGKCSLIVLKGPNEAGKSSGLRGVISALAGKKFDPEQPIRTGSKSGSVEITLADDVADRFQVSASWTPVGRYLSLREIMADGTRARLPAGQSMIQSMVGALSFSPLTFMSLRGPARLAMILDALGKRPAYDELQLRRKAVFDRRTDQNRKVRELQVVIAEKPDPSPQKVLQTITDDTLKAELDKIEAHNAQFHQATEKLAKHRRATAEMITTQRTKLESADQLEREANALREAANDRADEIQARQTKETTYEVKLAGQKPHKLDAVLERVNANRAHNQNVAVQQESRGLAVQLTDTNREARKLTGALEAIDSQILDLIRESDLAKSIPGVGITPIGDLTYEDRPIEQASGKRQLELTTLIGMAANKRLHVMCFDEGDRLDPDSIKHLGVIAEREDYQLWMTAVYAGQADNNTHIVQLLDGAIEGAPPPADPQAGVANMYKSDDAAAAKPASKPVETVSSVVNLDDLEL